MSREPEIDDRVFLEATLIPPASPLPYQVDEERTLARLGAVRDLAASSGTVAEARENYAA